MLTAPLFHHLVVGPSDPTTNTDTAELGNLSLRTEQFSFDPVSVLGEAQYGSSQQPFDEQLAHLKSLNPKECAQ